MGRGGERVETPESLAYTAKRTVQVMGKIDFDKVNYNAGDTRLEFAVFDPEAKDTVMAKRYPVVYYGVVPGNFDQAKSVVLKGKTSRETLVGAIMTTPVYSVRLEQSVEECMALMTEKRVRHLPVVERGKLVGMISQGDLVKFIIEDQRFIIGQLESYIAR